MSLLELNVDIVNLVGEAVEIEVVRICNEEEFDMG